MSPRVRRGVIGLLLGLATGLAAQEDPFGSAPDPFGVAPVASPADGAAPVTTSAATFDPDAVSLVHPAPGFELHGRINLTLALVSDREPVERLEHASLELSSADLYAQWFPTAWFGLLGEVELERELELEEEERRLEAELELFVAELRPLSDERLRLRAGLFPIPFGLERRYYAPPRNELANRPAAFRRVFPGTTTDLGVAAWIRQPVGPVGTVLELELALVRGLQGPTQDDRPEPFDKDEDGEPTLVGRAGWTVVDLDPARKGEHPFAAELPGSVRLTLGASGLVGNFGRGARRRLSYAGWDAELELGGLRVRFEAVLSRAEGLGRRGRDLIGGGLYALVAYHWRPDLLLLREAFVAYRYDLIDPDGGVRSELDLERHHWGVGWTPAEGLLFKAGWELIKPRGRGSIRVIYLELGYSF